MRVAVIGCGVIGKVHCKALERIPAVTGILLHDLVPERARALAGDRHAWTADPEALWSDPDIGMVCICTPHADHVVQLRRAVATGKHALCEKPLATTPADLAEMLALAEALERAGLMAGCVFQHRHSPLARAIREHVLAGDFGEVLAGDLPFRCTRTEAYYRSEDWRGTWAIEGGGVCINQAIHSLDMMLYLAAQPAAWVEARVACRPELAGIIEVETEAIGRLGLAGGAECAIDIRNDGITHWQPDCGLTCSRGRFRYSTNGDGTLVELEHDDPALVAELRRIEASTHGGEIDDLAGKREYGGLHAACIADAVEAARSGSRPLVSLADGAQACAAVLAIYHSAASGGPCPVPLPLDYLIPVAACAAT